MTADPRFWVLVAAFGAIWLGIAGGINRQLSPFATDERAPIGLVLGGIAIVVAVTAAMVLG